MEMCGAIFGGKDYKFTELKKKTLKKTCFNSVSIALKLAYFIQNFKLQDRNSVTTGYL